MALFIFIGSVGDVIFNMALALPWEEWIRRWLLYCNRTHTQDWCQETEMESCRHGRKGEGEGEAGEETMKKRGERSGYQIRLRSREAGRERTGGRRCKDPERAVWWKNIDGVGVKRGLRKQKYTAEWLGSFVFYLTLTKQRWGKGSWCRGSCCMLKTEPSSVEEQSVCREDREREELSHRPLRPNSQYLWRPSRLRSHHKGREAAFKTYKRCKWQKSVRRNSKRWRRESPCCQAGALTHSSDFNGDRLLGKRRLTICFVSSTLGLMQHLARHVPIKQPSNIYTIWMGNK